jgi:hypothetical protein
MHSYVLAPVPSPKSDSNGARSSRATFSKCFSRAAACRIGSTGSRGIEPSNQATVWRNRFSTPPKPLIALTHATLLCPASGYGSRAVRDNEPGFRTLHYNGRVLMNTRGVVRGGGAMRLHIDDHLPFCPCLRFGLMSITPTRSVSEGVTGSDPCTSPIPRYHKTRTSRLGGITTMYAPRFAIVLTLGFIHSACAA